MAQQYISGDERYSIGNRTMTPCPRTPFRRIPRLPRPVCTCASLSPPPGRRSPRCSPAFPPSPPTPPFPSSSLSPLSPSCSSSLSLPPPLSPFFLSPFLL